MSVECGREGDYTTVDLCPRRQGKMSSLDYAVQEE